MCHGHALGAERTSGPGEHKSVRASSRAGAGLGPGATEPKTPAPGLQQHSTAKCNMGDQVCVGGRTGAKMRRRNSNSWQQPLGPGVGALEAAQARLCTPVF